MSYKDYDNNIQTILSNTIREQKSIAINAHRRKVGSNGGVKFPSDFLTQHQKKALNSECKTFAINIPHTWDELKNQSNDIIQEYIDRLVDLGGNRTRIYQMLYSLETCTRSSLSIYHTIKQTNFNISNTDQKISYDSKINWNSWLRKNNVTNHYAYYCKYGTIEPIDGSLPNIDNSKSIINEEENIQQNDIPVCYESDDTQNHLDENNTMNTMQKVTISINLTHDEINKIMDMLYKSKRAFHLSIESE